MEAYWRNKAASIFIPGIIFVVLAISVESEVRFWQLLLMVMMAFGYTHFGIGYFYQIRALMHKSKRQREIACLHALTVLGLIFVGLFYVGGVMHFMPFFVIPYFLLNGFLNEEWFKGYILRIWPS